jgi:acetyl-CoA synthetase
MIPQAWGRTGDLAKMDEDGVLWYQGRSDDMFKSAGYRIGPGEIENCLVKHAAVANAAVIGVPGRDARHRGQGLHRAAAGETPSAANWRPRCNTMCASIWRPTSIPRSSSSSTPCR